MPDPREAQAEDALRQARLYVTDMVQAHRAGAIPALITACVGWAIENGAADLIRGSMARAIEMSYGAEAAFKSEQH